MSFRIFPSVRLLPNQPQTFFAEARDLQPMWTRVEGVVRNDFSVAERIATGGSQRSVFVRDSALQLVEGLGWVEFKIDNGCVPITPAGGTSGSFGWTTYFSGPNGLGQWAYRVGITPGSVSIFDETLAGIGSFLHSVAVGDRFRVELSNGFRLFVNDQLKHERTTGFTGGITYPAFYGEAGVSKHFNALASTGIPIVPAPLLNGNWRLREVDRLGAPIVIFTAPTEGVITPIGLSAQYVNGQKPGAYKLTGAIDVGVQGWFDDSRPSGSTLDPGSTGSFINSPPPAPISGNTLLRITNAAGFHYYQFTGATGTFQINQDDILTCWVFPSATNPPQQIQLAWRATDGTTFGHRAFWGADLLGFGTLGQPSRQFLGPLPPLGQWTLLKVPASLVDLEGRTLDGMSLELFDGACDFDLIGKSPGKLQYAEASITIPPLGILGDPIRTVQPSAVIRLLTTYDIGPGVTWLIIAGDGTLSGNEFTAPAAPGITILRASGPGNQVADLTLNIAPIITPNFSAASPGEQIDFNTNIGPAPIPIGVGASAEGQGDITPGLPLGLKPKDLLLLTVETANEAVPTPAGWNVVANAPQSIGTAATTTATRLSAFWFRVPPTGVVTAPLLLDVGDHQIARIRAYRNVIDTGNPWDITVGNTAASATAVSIPGGTTSVPNCLIVQAVAFATDIATPQLSGIANPDLASLAEKDDIATTQGNGGGFAIVEGKRELAGAFGATTGTLANASVQARLTIALKPALVVWSATRGSMNPSTGVWQAPADTDQDTPVKITATNGTFIATLDVFVLPLFPLSNPSAPLKVDLNKTVLISISEDRSSYIARVKDKGGLSWVSQEVQFLNCESDELEDVIAFWEANFPGRKIILQDNFRAAKPRLICYLDSNLHYEAESSCAINISFRVREA